MDDQEYGLLKATVLRLARLDINSYKSQQMRRRLDGFMTRWNVSDVADYCRSLEGNRQRLRQLLEFLTINVSEFFRDQRLFNYLENTILPHLLRQRPQLNIWSAACSCGQEPYSVAMMLDRLGSHRRHRILATDIDDDALARASSAGPYPATEVRGVDERLLSRFFTHNKEGYWVGDMIRSRVEFKKHNLLSDPMGRDFDLIICRNVVIYFSEEVRDRLYRQFNQSLRVDGVLFTGATEVLLRTGELGFASLSPCFYRKLTAVPTPVPQAA